MIAVYLKATNFCNVDCSHCYLSEETRADKRKMDKDGYIKVAHFVNDMAKAQRSDGVMFIWHGGEPLVLSPQYYEDAINTLTEHLTVKNVLHSMQTSLIPYQSKFAPLLKKHFDSFLGVSMDFNARTFKGSNANYQKLFLSKVKAARKDGIDLTASITPNKNDIGKAKEIFKFFVDNRFSDLAMDRYSNVCGTLPDWPTNNEHAQFLIDLFNEVYAHYKEHGEVLYVRPILAGIGGVLFGNPGDRWGGTCSSDFVVISPDGKLNACPDRDSYEASYGHLNKGYNSFKGDATRKKWIRIHHVGHNNQYCSSCEFNSFCKSGCPITPNDPHNGGCSGFYPFLKHLKEFSKDKEQRSFLEKYLTRQIKPTSDIIRDVGAMSIPS